MWNENSDEWQIELKSENKKKFKHKRHRTIDEGWGLQQNAPKWN